MEADEIPEKIQEAAESKGRTSAVYIAALAAALAIASLGGSNAAKEMMNANIEAADTFAFYQGKSVRQTQYQLMARSLELSVLSRADLTPQQRAEVEAEVAKYRTTVARYDSEPDTGEGKKELLAKARRLEEQRDHAAKQDPYFDIAEAALQLAIVMASMATVIGVSALLWLSGAFAAVGVLAAVNGFFLLVELPF
jgi:hypothetical protein